MEAEKRDPGNEVAKRSDLYTLCQSKLLENHTLHSGTYLYGPYIAVPPPPGSIPTSDWGISGISMNNIFRAENDSYGDMQ